MTRRSSVRARRGVSLHLEPHPPRVNFIIVRTLFGAGLIIISISLAFRFDNKTVNTTSIRGNEPQCSTMYT